MCDLIIILCTWLMILILHLEIKKAQNEVIVLRKAVILLLSIQQDKIRRMPGGK